MHWMLCNVLHYIKCSYSVECLCGMKNVISVSELVRHLEFLRACNNRSGGTNAFRHSVCVDGKIEADMCLVWFYLVDSHFSCTTFKVNTDEKKNWKIYTQNDIGKLFQLYFIYRLLPDCHKFISLEWLCVCVWVSTVDCTIASVNFSIDFFPSCPPVTSTTFLFRLDVCLLISPIPFCPFKIIFSFFRRSLPLPLFFFCFWSIHIHTFLFSYLIHQNLISKQIENWKNILWQIENYLTGMKAEDGTWHDVMAWYSNTAHWETKFPVWCLWMIWK